MRIIDQRAFRFQWRVFLRSWRAQTGKRRVTGWTSGSRREVKIQPMTGPQINSK